MMNPLKKVLVLLVTLLGALSLAACDDDESAGPEAGVDVEDVAEDEEGGALGDEEAADGALGDEEAVGVENIEEDDELVGQTVTVSAEVGRVLIDDKAFTIGEDVVDNGLLVLVPADMTMPNAVVEGEAVQVVGTVVDFTVADIEAMDEFGVDFFDEEEAELVVDFEDHKALIARSIQPAPVEDNGE